MRLIALALLMLPGIVGCATQHQQDAAKVKRSIDAVVVDESQRQKVLQAINAGDTPAQAMDKVSDGPKNEKPIPN